MSVTISYINQQLTAPASLICLRREGLEHA